MPGIGKTTTAKVVFNQLCYGFVGRCFLSNINETSKQFNGLALLQKQLLHDILKQDAANINCDDRGKVLIKERLCRKRVLVVADDVAHQDQLKALMGERSWFGPGSRVIITIRDSNLLREADQTYRIEELTRDQSLRLFSWHAFKDTKPAEDCIELSKDAVDYCGGLPLALEVIGACLYGKNKDRWKSEIDNLSRIPENNIQGKLLRSFDALDGELQNAFLDISCFFTDIEKEYVAKVLGARCRYNPDVVLETLRERSLIKVNAIGKITMHDLLRDMGREVVRETSPKEHGKRTRIWNQEDAWNVLEQQKVRKSSMHTRKHSHAYFLVILITNNHTKVLLFFFLVYGCCRGSCTGYESIRSEITQHRIICENKMLKFTPNQWSKSHRILQTAF
jgi:hypothetical protein